MNGSDGDDGRLQELGEKIRLINEAEARKKAPADERVNASSVWRVSSDLLGGVAAGSIVGLSLDHFLGTAPWLFLICFIMGTAAGFMMIYRSTAFDERDND